MKYQHIEVNRSWHELPTPEVNRSCHELPTPEVNRSCHELLTPEVYRSCHGSLLDVNSAIGHYVMDHYLRSIYYCVMDYQD